MMTAVHDILPPVPAHIHFVGIGGIGMSGLARILKSWGYNVTGSDSFRSEQVALLSDEGIQIDIGHIAVNMALASQLIVATAAVRDTNPEIHAAREKGTPVIKRAELLGLLANARTCVAVAGSHGKSTTSGMLVTALRTLGRDPSYAVGAIVTSTGTNAAPGADAEMVVEADEYDYSFLWLKPAFGIITNIDYDHPDLFPDQTVYDRAFVRFVQGFKPDSILAVNGDDPGVKRLLPELRGTSAKVVTYGTGAECYWRILDKTVMSPDHHTTLNLAVPGRHNISNAVGAMILLTRMGFTIDEAARAVESFKGIGRRFDLKGEINGITVVDDYAHHPEEIRATIQAARERFPQRRIVVAFQPHTYSRTKALLDPFADALSPADFAIVLDIYAARETDSLGISSSDIIARMSKKTVSGGKPSETVSILAKSVQSGDVVLTMGAGDVTLVGPALLQALADREQS